MAALLALRFLAELGMLTCLGIGGWRIGDSTPTSIVGAVVVPLVAASIWGRWVAPRAAHRLRDPVRLGVEVVLFAAAFAVSVSVTTWLAVGVCLAFLVSVPSRGHEPALSPTSG